MLNFANWEAPQYLMAILLVLSLVVGVIRHGKTVRKHFDSEGNEINDNSVVVLNFVMVSSLLAWGGFFA